MVTKGLTIRIEEELLHKLHVVASFEDRSANGQVLALIKKCIREHEEKYGEIKIK